MLYSRDFQTFCQLTLFEQKYSLWDCKLIVQKCNTLFLNFKKLYDLFFCFFRINLWTPFGEPVMYNMKKKNIHYEICKRLYVALFLRLTLSEQ